MFCPSCGKQLNPGSSTCIHCKAVLSASKMEGLSLLIPIETSGWAIASGYLGLFSVLLIPAPLALLTGILAIRHISKSPNLHGRGRAVLGIVLGTLGSIGLCIMLGSRFLP